MLAIGAIFRDEYDYLVEWFAWHMIAGFKRFLIADNGSTDGTLALLEALSDLGVINLIYQPVLEKQAQLVAYQRIAQLAINEAVESVLYIDADEFIVHESMLDGEEYRHLEKLMSEPHVGMVGINWRTFGSSGHKVQTSEPVLQRFTEFCNETEYSVNSHLKSITKVCRAKDIGPHKSNLFPGSLLIDSNGAELYGFIDGRKPGSAEVEYSSITRHVVESPLRINHYVIKSEQEFVEKKRRRGSAMKGISFDKGEGYFLNHDFDDATFIFPAAKLNRLKQEIDYVKSILNTTLFDRKLRGALDLSNSSDIRGWLVDENRQSDGIKINIFVNDVWQGRVACGFYRPDLKEKNISATGLSGFRYTHPKPLTSGDVVEVKVHANRYLFPGGGSATIV